MVTGKVRKIILVHTIAAMPFLRTLQIIILCMDLFLEILKYLLPSVIVLVTTWYLVRAFLSQEEKKTQWQLKSEVQKSALPVRLQAYERLVLLLERIEPAGLILRTSHAGMNAASLHQALVQTVRDEFDHNLSQQLYVSAKVWEMVRNSREEVIKLINTSMAELVQDSPASELAGKILMKDIEQTAFKVKVMEALKDEARDNFF